MKTKTICKILKDLYEYGKKHDMKHIWPAASMMHKWLRKIHPPKRHQTFDYFYERYVDEGE